MLSHRLGRQFIHNNRLIVLRYCTVSKVGENLVHKQQPLEWGCWKRTFSSANSSYSYDNVSAEVPNTPLERHNFKTKAQLWETYVETGEGVTELFDSFLTENPSSSSSLSSSSSSQRISAADFQRFLDQIDHKGIGDAEFHELDERKELDVKAFRSWARHATHDWSVHV